VSSSITPNSSYWQGLSTFNARQTALPGDNCSPYAAEPHDEAGGTPYCERGKSNKWLAAAYALDPATQSTLIVFVTSLLQAVMGAAAQA